MRPYAAICAVVALFVPPLAAAEDGVVWTAGDVRLVRNLQDIGNPAGRTLEIDDTVRVPIGGRLRAMIAGSAVQAWDDSEFRLVAGAAGAPEIEQIRGSLRVVGGPRGLVVKAPTARVQCAEGDDATIIYVAAGDYSEVVALAGKPRVGHIYEDFPGEVDLQPQQMSVVTLDAPPSRPGFVDRSGFARRLGDLQWTMPQPVADWDARFANLLAEMGDATWSRLRLAAGRPILPAWSSREPMVGEARPTPAGQPSPTPKSSLSITVDCPNDCQPSGGTVDAP